MKQLVRFRKPCIGFLGTLGPNWVHLGRFLGPLRPRQTPNWAQEGKTRPTWDQWGVERGHGAKRGKVKKGKVTQRKKVTWLGPNHRGGKGQGPPQGTQFQFKKERAGWPRRVPNSRNPKKWRIHLAPLGNRKGFQKRAGARNWLFLGPNWGKPLWARGLGDPFQFIFGPRGETREPNWGPKLAPPQILDGSPAVLEGPP